MDFIEIALVWLENPLVATSVDVVVIVVSTLLALRLANAFANRADGRIAERLKLAPSEMLKRRRTVTNIIRYTSSAFIVVVALMAILGALGVDVAPLIAGAGVAGIVIGLGTQNLMRDFLGGLFVLLENHYTVGDWITVGGTGGEVERVTLRMTQLRDRHGSVHIIPNGHDSIVTNMTKEWSNALLDVSVAYKEDVDRVVRVLTDVGLELESDPEWSAKLLASVEVPGVQAFADSSVDIRVIIKTKAEAKFAVLREMRRRIKNRFDAEGIEIPFPHRTLYVGGGAQGHLPVDVADPS